MKAASSHMISISSTVRSEVWYPQSFHVRGTYYKCIATVGNNLQRRPADANLSEYAYLVQHNAATDPF